MHSEFRVRGGISTSVQREKQIGMREGEREGGKGEEAFPPEINFEPGLPRELPGSLARSLPALPNQTVPGSLLILLRLPLGV